MSKKILNVDDIDNITIYEVINCKDPDHCFTEDIVVEFSKDSVYKTISFMDVGLINAKPDLRGYNNPIDIVSIDFYGKLQRKYVK